jgi:phage regulator Rha-like protein
MVVKKDRKLKWIFGISTVAVILGTSGAAYKWSQQKALYKKSQIEITELSNAVPGEIRQIRKFYQARNQFVLTLLSIPKSKTSERAQDLKLKLTDAFKQMNGNELQTKEQIARFERLAAYVNQLITDEVLKLNQSKKSILFTDQKQVRELERYDLAVDQARKSFAQTSWKLFQLKTTMEKNWTHKNNIVTTPYFPADVMVIDHQKKILTSSR